MRITDVEILRLRAEAIDVIEMPWAPTVIKVNTDEGYYGLGEIGLAYGVAEHGQTGLARDYARLLIGQDPFRIESIWESLYRTTFWGMGGGTLIFAVISAIDIALWDLKGKALGVPAYELLGGKTRADVRAYASQIQFDWDPVATPRITPDQYADATRKAMADGYDCVKVNPIGFDLEGQWMAWNAHGFFTPRQLAIADERMEAVRDAGGDDIDIIVELHCHTDANSAVQLGRLLEKHRCLYYEEPTGPLNWKNTKEIARRIDIPVATGERLWSRWGFRPYIENRAAAVLQPDLGICGGLSEGKRIADMASVYDIGVQMHLCGGPIATAAALQLEAVIPNLVIHEHNTQSLVPANVALGVHDQSPTNGRVQISDLPGIGQDLTEKAFASADRVVVR
jgi:galactonate dehydratase